VGAARGNGEPGPPEWLETSRRWWELRGKLGAGAWVRQAIKVVNLVTGAATYLEDGPSSRLTLDSVAALRPVPGLPNEVPRPRTPPAGTPTCFRHKLTDEALLLPPPP
jgi:hypothetical protein